MCLNTLIVSRYTVDTLVNSGLHFGTFFNKWNPRAASFLVGKRKNVFFFDVVKTQFLLKRACGLIKSIIYNRGVVLFVFSNNALSTSLSSYIRVVKQPFFSGFYKAGLLSNYKFSFSSFQKSFSLAVLPSAIVVVDTKYSGYALREAYNLKIPIVGLCDSDMDTSYFSYLIPGNNDSFASLSFLTYIFYSAIREEQAKEFLLFSE